MLGRCCSVYRRRGDGRIEQFEGAVLGGGGQGDLVEAVAAVGDGVAGMVAM